MKNNEVLREIDESLKKRIELLKKIISKYSNIENFKAKENEEFNLLLAELQSIEDYLGFRELNSKLEELKLDSTVEPAELDSVEAQMNVHKVWWAKMNKQVLDGYARIVDRDSRDKRGESQAPRISLTQIHLLANKAQLYLDSKEVVKD